MHGTNVTRLIIRKFAMLAVPPGGGMHSALNVLADNARRMELFDQAEAWVLQAMAVVRTAPGAGDWDDEKIAGQIMDKVDQRDENRRPWKRLKSKPATATNR